MNFFIFVIIILGLFFAIPSASAGGFGESQAGVMLNGEHELRRLTAGTYSEHKASGSFFLFTGDYSSTTKHGIRVVFSWRLNDGTYAISSIPIEKLRVNINANNINPTIKFRWRSSESKDLQYIIDNYVLYAVITCKSEDWPESINMSSLP